MPVRWPNLQPVIQEPLPHRLFYGTPGTDRVRYDNERGKGDHRHVGCGESPYLFSSIARLLDDFERDIKDWSPS